MALSRQNWPVDPGGKDAFYGRPSGPNDAAWQAQNLVPYAVPWTGHSVMVHAKVRASLDRVLTEYWTEIGHDQSVISKYGLADVETYNYRANRNNPSSLSNHSYGIAVDLAPNLNPNGSHWADGGKMLPRRLIELFKFEGWRWGGDFGTTSSGAEHGTKDPMHFEAVFDQHHDQQPVPAPASIGIVSTMPAAVTHPVLTMPGIGGELEGIIRAWGIREIGQSPEVVRAKQALQDALAALDALGQAQAIPTAPAPVQRIPDSLKPVVPSPAPMAHVQKGITATVFGGSSDRNTSAYDGHLITDSEIGFALPFHFPKPLPMISAMGPNGRTVTGPPVDVGPWNTNDPYWTTGNRPQAETGTDMHGRRTNLAGIDLTPATAKALGINGKGKVDWWFATQGETTMSSQDQGSDLPAGVTVGGSPFGSKINITAAAMAISALILYFTSGKLNLAPDQVAAMLTLIGTIAPVAIMLFRTFATTTILPHSLPKQ